MKPEILLVDDDPGIRFGFSRYLAKSGFVIKEAESLADAKASISVQRFDAVILDMNLPDGNGLDWIPEIRENYPTTAIIVITGAGDISSAVEAMRRGADNFVPKPVGMEDLVVFLRKSLEVGGMRRSQLISQRLMRREKPYFGESPAMKKVLELAGLASEMNSPVVLLGETGTGKGVLARWIHAHSSLRIAPFVEVDCSNLKGELFGSELFGHARGAFTSAVQDREGLIEVADGGVLFLDEIGEIDLDSQTQFLKVIEEKQYRRVGEVKVRRSDFRLICASNRDLRDESQHGRFRKDLYFRVYVFPIHLPPLRERPEDLPGLVLHFLREMSFHDTEASPKVIQSLQAYPWPGNIRELRNVLERAALLARREPLSIDHFSGLFSTQSQNNSGGERSAWVPENEKMSVSENQNLDSEGGAIMADGILQALKKRPEGMTRSQISALFGHHKSAREVSYSLNLLLEKGLASQERGQTGGRPVERWFAGGRNGEK
ncbi:MAG: sigma 54-interacting transcriptional regulator [Acidobacteriia bacterium]|nr:sigma 54-interacting transcriptional regulator [Terriglobia bacterium]